MTNILEEANQITHADRQKMYGPPKNNMEHIAKVSSALLEKNITSKDIVMIMIATKLCREQFKSKRDNLVDIAGYTWILDELKK